MTRTSDPRIVLRDFEKFVFGNQRELLAVVFRILTGPPEEGGTPIRTGFASSNWIPSKYRPRRSIVGSKADVNKAEQQAALAEVLAGRYRGGKLFLSNNVPYIGELNNGTSTQAPAGFVQAAVRRARGELGL